MKPGKCRYTPCIKLETFGLCDQVVQWIRSNLTGRPYRVQVADTLSQETRIESGVHQESAIAPLLFLLFIRDLPSLINLTTLLFAVDVKMVSPHSKGDLLQGSALRTQASPPWRLHSRMQNVSGGLDLDPSLFFYPTSAAWLERSSFQSSAGS